jgi:hypothetical protein
MKYKVNIIICIYFAQNFLVVCRIWVDSGNEYELIDQGINGQRHQVQAGQVPQLGEDQVSHDRRNQADGRSRNSY